MKRKIKRIIAGVMAVAMAGTLFASCSQGGANNDGKLKIGVIQLVEHDALDATYKGFKDALAEAGYSEDKGNVEFVYNNAQNDKATCVTIANNLATSDVDMVLAIATNAAQAVAEKIKDKPIIATAVTDFVEAGLVKSNEAPGTNVSGASDLNPISRQIDLLTQLVPDAKNVGILYCSSEPNSEVQAEEAKKALSAKNISSQKFTITAPTDIQSVVESMAGKVDAIYVPTDNTMATGMPTASEAATKLGIPMIVAEPAVVKTGGLATYGIDYYSTGKVAGKMALDVLLNNADISKMPVAFLNNNFQMSKTNAVLLMLTF